MKKILMLLFLISFGYSCTTIQLSEFINQTINTNSDCFIVINNQTNDTITFNKSQNTEYLYNETIILMPGQEIIKNTSNLTIKASNLKQNITINLSQNSIYIENITNTTFFGQPVPVHYCFRNSSENLNFGVHFYDEFSNMTYVAPDYPQINQIAQLTFGETYLNSEINLTIHAPVFPKLNTNKILNFGETYIDSQYNLSVGIVEGICYQNVNETLGVNGLFSNAVCNITTYGPTNDQLMLNEDIVAEFGKTKKSSKYEVSCIGPKRYDKEFNLTDEQTKFEDKEQGLVVNCDYNKTVIPTCDMLDVNISAINMYSANSSNLKALSYICKATEIINIDNPEKIDFSGCIQRFYNETMYNLSQTEKQRNEALTQVSIYKQPLDIVSKMREEDLQLMIIILAGMMIFVGVIVYIVLHSKKSRSNEQINAPQPQLTKTYEEYKKGEK